MAFPNVSGKIVYKLRVDLKEKKEFLEDLDDKVRHILKFLTHLIYVDKFAFNNINVAVSAISLVFV